MKPNFARLRRSARRYRLSGGLLAVLAIALAVALQLYSVRTDKAIDESARAQREVAAKNTEALKEFEQRRTEEELRKAQQERDEQAARDKANDDAPPQAAPAPSTPTVGCNQATVHNNPAAIDVVVNKRHCLVPLQFVPPDLVTTHGATISAKAASDFNRMFADAAAAGQPFTVSSSYRSYATQVSTYNYWVSVNGQQVADTVSARPGYSEHQTGLAVDVAAGDCILNCFGGTSQYQWFQANAANYGFIQRYYAGHEAVTGYAGEEWHYRYVGEAVALDMKARGIKTLEQYWGIEGGNYR